MKNLIPITIIAIASTLCVSCMTTTTGPHRISYDGPPTPYVPFSTNAGGGKDGYAVVQLSPDTYNVGFLGNGSTSMKRAQDFARFRAAEITVKTGYRYFRILDTTINHNAGALTRGNWASFPSAIYTIQCHNEFQVDSIDATQLMNILANSYQS